MTGRACARLQSRTRCPEEDDRIFFAPSVCVPGGRIIPEERALQELLISWNIAGDARIDHSELGRGK